MASQTQITTIKRKARRRAQGRKRKKAQRDRSTLTTTAYFAEIDGQAGEQS